MPPLPLMCGHAWMKRSGSVVKNASVHTCTVALRCHNHCQPLECSIRQLKVFPRDCVCRTNAHSPFSLWFEIWKTCTASKCVLRMLTRGYRLPFAIKPPLFNIVITVHNQGESVWMLQEEIFALLHNSWLESAEWLETFRSTLTHFSYWDESRPICLRLLGLIASAQLVVRLGRLCMRCFQHSGGFSKPGPHAPQTPQSYNVSVMGSCT